MATIIISSSSGGRIIILGRQKFSLVLFHALVIKNLRLIALGTSPYRILSMMEIKLQLLVFRPQLIVPPRLIVPQCVTATVVFFASVPFVGRFVAIHYDDVHQLVNVTFLH
jgi:hypothetical protein